MEGERRNRYKYLTLLTILSIAKSSFKNSSNERNNYFSFIVLFTLRVIFLTSIEYEMLLFIELFSPCN